MYSKKTPLLFLATLALSACGNADVETAAEVDEVAISDNVPVVTFTPGDEGAVSGKPMGPITVGYRIVGTPVVGQPVAIDLQVTSSLGPQPISVGYRINDATAMRLADSQPATLKVSPPADEGALRQQVTIIPLREGRLYLNVSASVETANGSMSTVTAIPIQVGDGPRDAEENGTLTTDENGEAIRSLPAE